jgi:hypothetical protein
MKIPEKPPFPIHPILITIAPVLSLYIINKYMMYPEELGAVMGVLVLISCLFLYLLNRVIHNNLKTAFLFSTFLILMFSFQSLIYGVNVFYILTGASEAFFHFITQESFLVYCLVFLLFVFTLICIKILKVKSNLYTATNVLNVFSGLLILMVLISWVQVEAARIVKQGSIIDNFSGNWNDFVQKDPCLVKKIEEVPPDIYIVILDGYGRDDVLKQMYGMDNSWFITELEKRGFFVARNARSNYRHTQLTTGSLLNYDYFESLAAESGLDLLNVKNTGQQIQNNRTFHQLACLGYSFYTIDTGYYYTEFKTGVKALSTGIYPSRFVTLLADSTPLTIFTLPGEYQAQRDRTHETIKTLNNLPSEPSPKLVFADVMTGHSPFIFDENGQSINPPRIMLFDSNNEFTALVDRSAYEKGYRDQVTYISKEILKSVDLLLANSKNPPIVLLFGDHGPSGASIRMNNAWERMSIFSSYYFPGHKTSQLFADISPVNSMRVVFNTYFGTEFPILPYKGNFAPDTNLYDYQDVTKDVPNNIYQ